MFVIVIVVALTVTCNEHIHQNTIKSFNGDSCYSSRIKYVMSKCANLNFSRILRPNFANLNFSYLTAIHSHHEYDNAMGCSDGITRKKENSP